jgi:hypothetical protein
MVFEFGFQKIDEKMIVVSINPNVFNEVEEVREKLIKELSRRLNAEIPFEFTVVSSDIKRIEEESRYRYFCINRIIEFEIPMQEAMELLRQKNFQSKVPHCCEQECSDLQTILNSTD